MNEKTLAIIIKAKDEASKVFKDVGQSMEKTVDSSRQFAGAMAVVGTAVAGVAIFAVKSAADYEQSLNIMQSVSGATGEEMKKVAARARELGKDITLPGVSAKDAALAMVELSKAGLSVNDTLAASKGVLSLAKAGQLATADAALITANALNSFSLKGSEANRVADLLAAAANASSASVQDMAYALQMSSASAAAVKVPVQDLTTAIAAMANNGIKGSDAGTSLKSMFMNLIPTTTRAKASMAALNLDFYDAKGNFVGLRDMVDQLQKGTAKLTDEQKAQHIENIFGADSMRAANILIKEGVAGYDKLSAAVNKNGAATALAAAQNSGLNGAIDNVRSTLETLAIDVGSKIVPALTALALIIANNINPAFQAFASFVTQNAPIIVGAVVGGLIPAFVSLGISIWTAMAPLIPFIAAGAALGFTVNALAVHFGGWNQLMTVAASVLTSLYNVIAPILLPALKSLWSTVETQLIPTIQKFWAENKDLLIPVLYALAYIIGGVLVAAVTALIQILNGIIQVVTAVMNILRAFFQLGEAIFNGLISTFHYFTGNVSAARNSFSNSIESMKNVISSLRDAVVNAVAGIANIITAPFAAAANSVQSIIGTIRQAIGSVSPGNIAKGIEGKLGIDIPGFATGGYTGRGGKNEVAGIVHRGEYVIPKEYVNQGTGTPMIGGGGVTINMMGATYLDSDERVSQLAQRVAAIISSDKEMGSYGVGI